MRVSIGLSASRMGGVRAQLGSGDAGALGPGMGLRAGYTIDQHIYMGAQVLFLRLAPIRR